MPQDIKDKVFTKAVFGGYDMSGVEDFIDTVSEDYAALYKENALLKNKLKVLVDKVEEYRSTEDAMRMALLNAQHMADDIVTEANNKKEQLLREAELAASERIRELKTKVDEEERRYAAAQVHTAEFVDAAGDICKKQMEFLNNLGKLDLTPKLPPEERSLFDAESEEQLAAKKAETAETKAEETAKSIEDSVMKLFDEDTIEEPEEKPEPGLDETRVFTMPADDEKSRVKSKFKDLKFGANYEQDEDE